MRKALLAVPLLAAVFLSLAVGSRATVEIAKKEKQKCVTCHVKMGSKELNPTGQFYAEHRTLAGYPPAAPVPPAQPAPPAKPAPPPQKPEAPAPPAAPTPPAPPPAPQRLLIYRYEVDPAQFLTYEDALKGWVEAAKETGVGEEFAWEVAQSDPFTYWIFLPIADFRRLDPTSDLTLALQEKFFARVGEERTRELQAAGRPGIRRGESWVIESAPEFDYEPADAPAAETQMAHIDIERVRPDRVAEYEELLARLGGILRQAQFPQRMRVYRSVTGPEFTYYLVFPVRDRKDLFEHYRWMEEALPQSVGKEAWARLIADWAATIEDFHHYDEIGRPDLSYRPAPEE